MEYRRMRRPHWLPLFVIACVAAMAGFSALAQQKSGIVCWKDKSGKTVGCGDKVPPEYQDNANKVLNQRGMTIKQTDAALTAEQLKAQAAEAEQKKIEAVKREEERRRDRALLDSFTNEKEIDLKRTRDIQQIEVNISAQQSNLKNVNDRQTETRIRMDQYKKDNKPVPAPIQEDFDRLATERSKIQAQILQKRQEIVDRNLEYDEMKKRFMELKGVAPAPGTSAAKTPVASGGASK
jgi:hypothetical protein